MEPEKQTELESNEQGDASIQTFSSGSVEEAAVTLKDLELSNEADRSKQSMGGARPKESAGKREPGDASIQTFSSVSAEEAAVTFKDLELSNEADRSKQSMGGARPKENAGKRKSGAGVSKKYYGVSLPSASLRQADNRPLVYEDKVDAITAIKTIPGARFKEFSSRDEAFDYASVPSPSPYREFQLIRSGEMLQLQRFIETGNEASFLALVWSNPRYLVNVVLGFGSNEPTIVQGRRRRNALHIAAICGQTGMFISILYVIQDHQFLSALYPYDPPEAIQSRIERLVELYLNMPDEMSQSPLHYACKCGHESIVSIMLSYPQCEVEMRNRDGCCAKDLVCQRHKCKSRDHKERMRAVFDDVFYVPLLQDDGHGFVGPPCDCNTVLIAATSSPHKEGGSVYCSFAGPASQSQARNFYTILETKEFSGKSVGTETLAEMCLSDPEKGLQRAGRILCKDFSLGWLEYWSGLDCWLDMCSPEGLDRLNDHLKKQNDLITLQQGEVPPFSHLIENFMNEFAEKIPSLVVNSRHLFLFYQLQSLIEHMECFTKYLYSNEPEICDIHQEVGHMLYLKLTNDNNSNLKNFQSLKLFLLFRFSHPDYFQKRKWKMLSCILRFAFYFQSPSTDIINLFMKKPVCNCDYMKVDESYHYSSKSCYYAVVSLRQELTNQLVQQYTEPKEGVEEPKQALVIPLGGLPLNCVGIRNNSCFLITAALYPDTSKVSAFETMYLTVADLFYSECFCIMSKYARNLPFARLGYFFDVMSIGMDNWKKICSVNYYEDCHLLHYELACCLGFKMLTAPNQAVKKWKAYLEDNSFTYKMTDLVEHGMTSTREWMHLLCILKQFCFILDNKTTLPVCTCTFNKDHSKEFVHPVNCLVVMRRLRDRYNSAVRFVHAGNSPSTCSDDSKHLMPPESPDIVKEMFVLGSPDTAREVFVGGEDMSDDDIDVFLALTDARVLIRRFQHPYVFRWKICIEARLG